MVIRKNKWAINTFLLFTGVITSMSGIIIQIGYHLGNPDNVTKTNRTVLGFGYADWVVIHKIAIVIFGLLCIYHIYIHRKWYRAVLTKRLLRKKNKQVLFLSGLFFLSAITGIVPWIIDSYETNQSIRLQFIEIHDKISLFLMIFILLHVIRRIKRFI